MKRLLCIVLACVICLGALPLTGGAATADDPPAAVTFHAPAAAVVRASGAAPEAELTEEEAVSEPVFSHFNLSGVLPAHVDPMWLEGQYDPSLLPPAAQQKALCMFKPAYFVPPDEYADTQELFVPASSEGSWHELTLYGDRQVDPTLIRVSGAEVDAKGFTEHLFGDPELMPIWWYTARVFLPAENTILQIAVDEEMLAPLPVTRLPGSYSPAPLITSIQTFDYTENEEGLMETLTLRLCGLGLHDDPERWRLYWDIGEEEDPSVFPACTQVLKDELGYSYLTFTFPEPTDVSEMHWLHFEDMYGVVMWFDKDNHLIYDDSEDPDHPYRLRQDYSDPAWDEDDPLCWYHMNGTYVELPHPFGCLFRDPAGSGGEDPEIMPSISGDYYNEAAGMCRTYNSMFWMTVHPGSYEGGEVVFSDDIHATDYLPCSEIRDGLKQAAYMALNPSDPDYGVRRIWATFSKEGLRTVKVGPLLVDYVAPKAPTPRNPGCEDAAGTELERVSGGIPISGGPDGIFRFHVNGPKGVTMYLMFCFTEAESGNVYQTGNTLEMDWNPEAGRYELDVKRSDIPCDAEQVFMQILNSYNGGYRDPGDPVAASLWNPEPGFRMEVSETTDGTVSAFLYAKGYAGGTVAVSLDGGESWGEELAPENDAYPYIVFTLPEPGEYDVLLRFTRDGLEPAVAGPAYAYYDDGRTPAPADAGVLLYGEPVSPKNGAYVLSGGEEDAYTFYASADEGLMLEAVFRSADGEPLLTRDLSWTGMYHALELSLPSLYRAASVSFRAKAGEDGRPGRERTLELRVPYLKTLYAPTVSYELKADGDGDQIFAVAPGAVFGGEYEISPLSGLSSKAVLRYRSTGGAEKTGEAVPEDLGGGQYRIALTLPDDADRLISLSYELWENGLRICGTDFDLTGWRVWARTKVTGIPESYIGGEFTIRGKGVDLYAVLTAENYAGLDLGDLPTGDYTYELTGRSGHIAGGAVSIVRGADMALTGLPGLGSLTVTAAGEEVNARVNLSLITPDGEAHTASGTVGTVLNDLPVGTQAKITLEYDSGAYPGIIGYSPADRTVTIAGAETAEFTFARASYRTVKGHLVREEATAYNRVCYVNVCVQQQIMRNGKPETYTATARTNYNGEFEIPLVYDGVDAEFRVLHITYAHDPITVTETGDVDLGDITVRFSTELVVPVKLILATPSHVGEDGRPYRDSEGNLRGSEEGEVLAESAVLPLNTIIMSSGGSSRSLKAGTDFDVFTMGGNKVLRFHEGVIPPGASLRTSISAMSFPYGEHTYAMGYTNKEVTLDENGNAVLEIYASRVGGEIRATVAPEGSGMVGFLRMGSRFVYGTGELCLIYDNARKNALVYSGLARPEEAEEYAAYIRSLGENAGSSIENGCSKWLNLQNNQVLYLENMTPSQPVGAGTFGAYRFGYETELSTKKGCVILKGTIEKRYPDAEQEDVIDNIEVFSGSEAFRTYFNYTLNGEEIRAAEMDPRTGAGEMKWHNRKDENGFYRPTLRLSFWCELPLDDANQVHATLKLHTYRLQRTDAEGKAVYGGYRQQYLGASDTVDIFDLSVPDMLFIREEQERQRTANWTAPISLRTYVSDVPSENEITIWDNGVAVDTFTVSSGRYASTVFVRNVRLTNSGDAGLHTLWATRELDGETIVSYSQSLPVLLGGEHDKSVHIADIHWLHWNQKVNSSGTEPDYMIYSTPASLEGEEVWIWPSKRHDMRFSVLNATSKELAGVNFVWTAMVEHSGWNWTDNMGNHGDTWLHYWTQTTCSMPCEWYGDYTYADGTPYSRWGFSEKYLGYITGFNWEFVYKAEVDTESVGPALEDRVAAELEALYAANDLGAAPDDGYVAGELNKAGNEQLRTYMAEDGDLVPEILRDLQLNVKEGSDSRLVLEAAPTADVPSFRIEMREGEVISGAQEMNEKIWKLMETEREFGSQDPEERPEDGWRVYWAETDSLQGSTLTRLAVLEEQTPDGRYHYAFHRRVYLPVAVAEALNGGPVGAELMDARDDFIDRADRGKKVYDTFNDYYTYADLSNTIYVNQMEKEMRVFMGSAEAGEKWGKECSFVSDRAGKAMAILGVADTAYSFYKGPDGKDGTGLRQLLEHVQDERFRKSIEFQIRDYEDMRQAIFQQDMTMKTLSSASNFYTPGGIWMKLSVFLGGLGNGYLSDQAKQFNQQVYDTTLLDIQRQIRFERVKASRPAAEKWLRDKMDSIYGKGNWSEYALEQERKLWVLEQDETGAVHYVWHEKAGQYKPVWDPSGFVFEAVEDNTLEGVTATLYFSDTVNEAGEPIDFSVWTDERGVQANPTRTQADGVYQWMVPNGWWKVRYEKDGYLIAESKPMRVPPIHTTVNIGLLSTEAPTARVSVGGGEITVLFSKYMQLESLIRLYGGESYRAGSFDASAFAVQFYDASGAAVPGTVRFPDKAANTGYKGEGYGRDVIASDWFVRTAVFTPSDPEADLSGVTWRFADGMVSYSGAALDKSGTPANLYRIAFDPEGGALRESAMLTGADGALPSLPTPILEDWEFDGWFTSGGSRVEDGYVFTADETLSARWVQPPQLTYSADEQTITVRNGSGLARTCVIAWYDADGRLLRTEVKPIPEGESICPVPEVDADCFKAFLLDAESAPVSAFAYVYLG